MRYAVFLILLSRALLTGQQVEARISAEPFLSPDVVAQLEAKVGANPADKETRLQLLRQYTIFAPSRSARLNHILYLVENLPSDPVSSSALTYVRSADGSDHSVVRDAWLRAAARFPSDANVLLNAARFLYREHPEEAEQLLSGAVDRDPANKKIAANLGFLYALDILGMTSSDGFPVRRTPEEHQRLRERALVELDRSRNIFVLAGAGVALPNLFPRTAQARDPNDRSAFETASRLMARARELAPQEAEFAGPMPLIREFQEFQQREGPAVQRETSAPAAAPPGAIRVGGAVQAAKLVEKPEAPYPTLAKEARIQGMVRINVIIGQNGQVENATVASGHPLLVPPALDAVRQYRYQPTLLNGSPVSVISQVEVPFLFQ